MQRPKDIQIIGNELAVIWSDGEEGFIEFSKLRAASPSAETAGERDIFGTQYGGESGKDYSKVEVLSWKYIGGYAVQFQFSDGHRTGLYSFEYLRKLTNG